MPDSLHTSRERYQQLTFLNLGNDGDFEELKSCLKSDYAIDVEFQIGNSNEQPSAGVVDWVLSGNYSLFSFSPAIVSHPYLDLLAKNWAWEIPLLLNYARRCRDASGTVRINIEDMGRSPGLAYCDHRPDFHLIPDPIFIGTEAYHEQRTQIDARAPPWSQRKPVVFWRGATTGWHNRVGDGIRSWRELPRIVLAELAQRGTMSRYFDVGISSTTQLTPADAQQVVASGLMRDFVPLEALGHYQAHIDIDGNTNAWMALFAKLASGSPVLKVQSACGFKQWYYDRLIPWVNYIPVSSSMDDLNERAEWIFHNPVQAQSIGEHGRKLAVSMSLDDEIDRAFPVITNAFKNAPLRS